MSEPKNEVWVVLWNGTEQMAHAEKYYAEEQGADNFGEHLGDNGEKYRVVRYVPEADSGQSTLAELESAMAHIKASGHAGSAIMSVPQILAWAREIGWRK